MNTLLAKSEINVILKVLITFAIQYNNGILVLYYRHKAERSDVKMAITGPSVDPPAKSSDDFDDFPPCPWATPIPRRDSRYICF